MSAFEYSLRWSLLTDHFPAVGDLLETRDRELENFLRNFSGCHSGFEYKHRWPQMLPVSPGKLEELMETHMTELENEINSGSFSCFLEFPFRADQLIPYLLSGDPIVAVLLNENDLTLESSLDSCHCGGGEG